MPLPAAAVVEQRRMTYGQVSDRLNGPICCVPSLLIAPFAARPFANNSCCLCSQDENGRPKGPVKDAGFLGFRNWFPGAKGDSV